MAKKNNEALCHVKYERETYSVSRAGKYEIDQIKFKLFLKRIKRRFCVAVPQNISLYIAMLAFFGVFLVLIYFWGNAYKAPIAYTWMDALWDIKFPFFTSVFLAAVIVVYSQVREYKKRLKEQNWIYLDMLNFCDDFVRQYLGKTNPHYMPFYTDKCVADTQDYLESRDFDSVSCSDNVIRKSLDKMLYYLDEIEKKVREDAIIGSNPPSLWNSIKSAKDFIEQLKEKPEIECSDIKELIWILHRMIAALRRPWRWDLNDEIRILEILEKNNKECINRDIFYRMKLHGIIS